VIRTHNVLIRSQFSRHEGSGPDPGLPLRLGAEDDRF
jgi:hypothetical protein